MAVPDFQSLMLPVLRALQDGSERPAKEVRAAVATALRLSAEDLAEILPSGRQTRFTNRAVWAMVYLRQAGLLQSTRRGFYQISERGKLALGQGLDRIDIAYLEQFPEYQAFKNRSSSEESEDTAGAPASVALTDAAGHVLTPDEQIRIGYQQQRAGLAAQLLERVKQASPEFFETLVINLLVAMGYGGTEADAAKVVGRSGDGGIDGIIKEDRLGFDFIYVQAKRWEGSVGRPTIQQFAGALQGRRARKGIVITTSTFSKDAIDYAANLQTTIVLMDGTQLAQYMIDFGVGVSETAVVRLKRIDEDYFGEE